MTTDPTPAVHAAATALAARHRVVGTLDLDNLHTVERGYWIGSARATLTAGLDLDRMTDAYGTAQYGLHDWETAPAAIRNDIRQRMAAVITNILGES